MPFPIVAAVATNLIRTYGTAATTVFPAAATAFAVGAGLQNSDLQANLQSKGNVFVNELAVDAGKAVRGAYNTVSDTLNDASSFIGSLVSSPELRKSNDNASTVPSSRGVPTPATPTYVEPTVANPRPTATPETPPPSSSSPSAVSAYTPPAVAADTLLSVLKSSGEINAKALLAIALAIKEGQSSDRVVPSTPSSGVSLPIQKAVQPQIDNGSAVWSDDGNSLVVKPSSSFSNSLGEAVVSGDSVVTKNIPYALKQKALTTYADLGIKPQEAWRGGLQNVSLNPNTLKNEAGIINQYLDGQISKTVAADAIVENRYKSIIPVVDVVETVKVKDAWGQPLPPSLHTVVSRAETVRPATIPNSYVPATVTAPPATVSVTVPVPVVNVQSPDISINNTLDLDRLIVPIQLIADAMPDKVKADEANTAIKEIPLQMIDKVKTEKLIDAKQEALDYSKTPVSLNLLDGAPASVVAPREATFLAKAHEAIKTGEINNMKFDDIDLGLGGVFSSLMELGYTGVYDSMMSASASIKEAHFDYDTSFSESNIPLFALSAALS